MHGGGCGRKLFMLRKAFRRIGEAERGGNTRGEWFEPTLRILVQGLK
jgi:hypothetical protein